ncbi:Protein ENHANCED DISEASE RESISTANCE 2 [Zea mays]|uniref:Protein ENHANCED DISEASE RESISTANCE 2 n=1 Tax=Zea mays TaxID=4577 RepID=A0A1D6LJZ5_MAIZE|nr:Protein ENHANCED DISEASE RESISTANCE 2 [Zea mays]
MLSSSASRRDAARSGAELPRPHAVAGMARSGELPKGAPSATAPDAVRCEGWMVRHGRRKIGRSFFHTRYFVLDNGVLAYYKKKPRDHMIPLKSIIIDGNCRVEDRGLKTHHGQMIYLLCIYNKKEKENQITMGGYDIEDALAWKRKIELLIDQQQDTTTAKNHKAFASLDFDIDLGGPFSFSDHDSGQVKPEDEEEPRPTLLRRTTIGNGPPDSVLDWTKEADSGLSNQNATSQAYSRKNWRLLRCQNGKFTDCASLKNLWRLNTLYARSYSRAMRAVGVVEASCEAIFGLVMSMDASRYEWDCSFQYGSLVEEVDGHTAILYHRLQLNWFSMLVWPRDLCYVRYWRRNDDGSYVVLFRSTENQNCGPQPGFVRASIERLREYFSQTDEIHTVPRIPVMHTMVNAASMKKDQNLQEPDSKTKQADNKHLDMVDEESEDDDDYQVPDADVEEEPTKSDSDAKNSDPIDLSWFSGIIRQDTNEKSRNCWAVPDSKIFKVRSKNFPHDKSKVPAGKYLMELVAVDWFKDAKRMDHVARRKGSAVQVAAEKGMFTFLVNIQIPGPSHYSLVLYFVSNSLKKGSLLQRFADGDDDFRNSRLKLIPSVPKGSWIVRQSVGSTPCLLGKAVDCSYLRGPDYLEVDVDIGSSAVANGVLGLVFGVVTTLVVDMAFLIQANTYDELPEQLLGAARLSHIEPSAAVYPVLDNIS